jgi:hypothetical protein
MRHFIAILAILWAGMAQAAQVTILGINSHWSNASVQDNWGGNANLSGTGTNELRWGHSFSGKGERSGFRFDQTARGTTQNAGALFNVGTFTHMNRVIFEGQHLRQATLNMSVTAMFDGKVKEFVTSYIFTLLETQNYAQPCRNGQSNGLNGNGQAQRGGSTLNRNGCSDRVELLKNPSLATAFSHNGLDYQFELLGFESGSEFWTVEDLNNPIFLKARFTASGGPVVSPVPLPAGAWFLIAGIGALAVMRRRAARG